jgi:AcrR family transcriptional regulator
VGGAEPAASGPVLRDEASSSAARADPRRDMPPAAAKILAAAQRILVAEGFGGLTLRAIAQESGENSAMVQYYFGNKAGLVEAMIDSSFRDEQQEVAAAMSMVTNDELLPRFVEGLRTVSSSRSFRVFFDVLPHALRNESWRSRMANAMDWYREIKLDWLGARDERLPVEQETLLGLADLMTAVVDGLAIPEAVDDDFDMRRAYAVLELMLERSLPELLATGVTSGAAHD